MPSFGESDGGRSDPTFIVWYSGRFSSVARSAITSVLRSAILRIPATLILSAVSVGLW